MYRTVERLVAVVVMLGALANAARGINPTSPTSLNYRGIALGKQKQYDKAIKEFTEAIRLAPEYAAAYHNRGMAWFLKGEYDKAIKDFTEAIRLKPTEAGGYFDRGRSWFAKKADDKAIKDFTAAIRLKPSYAPAFVLRGVVWYLKKEYDKAIKDLTEAIRLDPKDAHAQSNLAYMQATCSDAKYRDGKKAVELAKKACDLTNWKWPDFIATLAAAHAEAGDFTQAVKYQKQAMTFLAYAKQEGEKAKKRLKLYEGKKPYRG